MSATFFYQLIQGVTKIEYIEKMKAFALERNLNFVPTKLDGKGIFGVLSIGATSNKDRVLTIVSPTNFGVGTYTQAGSYIKKELHPWSLGLNYMGDSFWTANLFKDGQIIDEFCTLPHYLECDADVWHFFKGQTKLVAQAFEVSEKSIERYYRWWEHPYNVWEDEDGAPPDPKRERLTGKAYPQDEHAYWDPWQVTDFAQALSGLWPPADEDGNWQHFEFLDAEGNPVTS